MSRRLQLLISTPQRVLVQADDILSLRAEDASGSFGLLPGHVDFLTVLVPTVMRWKHADGRLGYCAVEGGVLCLQGGRVELACRHGVLGDDLPQLEERVRAAREQQRDLARRARVEHLQLHTRAVRQLVRYLRGGGDAPLDLPGDKP